MNITLTRKRGKPHGADRRRVSHGEGEPIGDGFLDYALDKLRRCDFTEVEPPVGQSHYA
jgi:hypothetical protein